MKQAKQGEILSICSGDLRLSTNQNRWPADVEKEAALMAALRKEIYYNIFTL